MPCHYYDVTARTGAADLVSGMPTPILGYNARVPGPLVSVDQGTRIVMRVHNQLPGYPPDVRHPAQDLHPPARVGVAAAVRRVRQRRHPLRARRRTTTTRTSSRRARSGTTTTACTSPRRTPTRAWPRSTTCTTRPSAHCCRRASSTSRSRSPTSMFNANGAQLYDDRSQSGPVGRRHPGQRPALAGDEGEAADLPLPHPERLHLPVLPAHLLTGAPDVHGGHRRRPDARSRSRSAAGGTATPSATRS